MACVRALLDAGAGGGAGDALNHITPSGHTALLLVVIKGHVECTRALIEAGANVNQPIVNSPNQDENGMTPLILATRKGRVDIVRALIEAGAELNHRDRVSVKAIHSIVSI